jgi:hypothetical protein
MTSAGEPTLDSALLSVRFVRGADRYRHLVSLASRAGYVDLLESVEGAADEAWPASPPLQWLDLSAPEPGRTLALLVGMAGKSHWSASIELHAMVGLVVCDVACRVHGAARGPLGSCYRALGPLRALGAGRILVDGPPGHGAALAVEIDVQSGGRLAIDGDVIRIEPALAPQGTPAQTIRWTYSIYPARA